MVEYQSERNLRRSDSGTGTYVNASETAVMIRVPSPKELNSLLNRFMKTLTSEILTLFSMPFEEYKGKYGGQQLRSEQDGERQGIAYGLIADGGLNNFVNVNRPAVSKILAGRRAEFSAAGRRGPAKLSSAAQIYEMPLMEQVQIVEKLVTDSKSIDDYLRFAQTGTFGWAKLKSDVRSVTDVGGYLAQLERELADCLFEQQATGKDGKSGRGTGREYGPSWFAMYLASQGIWALPAKFLGPIRNLLPPRLMPVVLRSLMPSRHRALVDQVIGLQELSRHTSATMVLNCLAISQISSNVWQHDDFDPEPLMRLKEWTQHSGSQIHSSSVNALYRLAMDHFCLDIAHDKFAPFFTMQKRLAKSGAKAYDWVFNPKPRNTQLAERCLGRPVTEVEDHVRDWAEQLRELLPLVRKKALRSTVNNSNPWLIYIQSLPLDAAPKTFRDINRRSHVNDFLEGEGGTFVHFLAKHFSEHARNICREAIKEMRDLWSIAARRDGFAADLTNPFDPTIDQIVPPKPKSNHTHRPALSLEAWRILIEENRKDNYAFARNLDRNSHWIKLKDPTTGRMKRLFWPAVPIALDVILHFGTRNKNTRFLDSGEGDEYLIDIKNLDRLANPLETATKDRSEGCLRIYDMGHDDDKVLGIFINTNKTGGVIPVPFIPERLAASLVQLRDLQMKYNPLKRLVLARQSDTTDDYVDETLFELVAPLFRWPDDPLQMPISESRLLTYFKALLKHCQPIVNEKLGYDYPLFADDKAFFDLHSMRASLITLLYEAGADEDVIVALAGHASPQMSRYYRVLRLRRVRETLIAGYERLENEEIAIGKGRELEKLAESAVFPDDEIQRTGVELVMSSDYRSGHHILFMHGLCPVMNCMDGGNRIAGSKYAPVWRPNACSKCRYRITGPHFIEGLRARANMLMYEYHSTLNKMADLGKKIEEKERLTGERSVELRRIRDRDLLLQHNLKEEWESELKVIRICEGLIKRAEEQHSSASNLVLPMNADFDRDTAISCLEVVHEFELMHAMMVDTVIMPSSIMDLPSDVELRWKSWIREFANSQGYPVASTLSESESDSYIRVGNAIVEQQWAPEELEKLVRGLMTLEGDQVVHESLSRLAHG